MPVVVEEFSPKSLKENQGQKVQGFSLLAGLHEDDGDETKAYMSCKNGTAVRLGLFLVKINLEF